MGSTLGVVCGCSDSEMSSPEVCPARGSTCISSDRVVSSGCGAPLGGCASKKKPGMEAEFIAGGSSV